MKICVIGDIHGRSRWKEIVEGERNVDLFIFLGDYVSTHESNITPTIQIDNLLEILAFKEENPEKVILLRGNHDMQHLGYYWAECSGFFKKVSDVMSTQEVRDRYLRDTQWVYVHENIIFSHAGITKRWFEDSGCERIEDINNLEPSELFGFRPCKMSDYYGISETQGPTWIRPQTLFETAVPGYDQVVGHTTVENIINIKDAIIKENKKNPDFPIPIPTDAVNIILCDCGLSEYLVIEDGKFKVIVL